MRKVGILWLFASGCCGEHACCGDVRGYGNGELTIAFAGLVEPWGARTTGVGEDDVAYERMWDLVVDPVVQDVHLPHPGAAALIEYDASGGAQDVTVAARLDDLERTGAWTRCGATVASVELVLRHPYGLDFRVVLEDASGGVIEAWSPWTVETTAPYQRWSDGFVIDQVDGGLSGAASFTSPPVDGCADPAEGARFEIAWSFDAEPTYRHRLACGW